MRKHSDDSVEKFKTTGALIREGWAKKHPINPETIKAVRDQARKLWNESKKTFAGEAIEPHVLVTGGISLKTEIGRALAEMNNPLLLKQRMMRRKLEESRRARSKRGKPSAIHKKTKKIAEVEKSTATRSRKRD